MQRYSFIKKVNGETDAVYNLTLRAARKQFEAAEAKGRTSFHIRDAETGKVVVKSGWSEKRVYHTLRYLAVQERRAGEHSAGFRERLRERVGRIGRGRTLALQALVSSLFSKS